MAEGLADKIEHEKYGYANPLATLIRAGLAKQQGDLCARVNSNRKSAERF